MKKRPGVKVNLEMGNNREKMEEKKQNAGDGIITLLFYAYGSFA